MAYCTHTSWSQGVGSAVHRIAMLRRGRNGRARHLAWSQTRQETDAMAVIQISDREEWESQTTTTQVRIGFVGVKQKKKWVICEREHKKV